MTAVFGATVVTEPAIGAGVAPEEHVQQHLVEHHGHSEAPFVATVEEHHEEHMPAVRFLTFVRVQTHFICMG